MLLERTVVNACLLAILDGAFREALSIQITVLGGM